MLYCNYRGVDIIKTVLILALAFSIVGCSKKETNTRDMYLAISEKCKIEHTYPLLIHYCMYK